VDGQVLTFGREPVYVRAAELPPATRRRSQAAVEKVDSAPPDMEVIELLKPRARPGTRDRLPRAGQEVPFRYRRFRRFGRELAYIPGAELPRLLADDPCLRIKVVDSGHGGHRPQARACPGADGCDFAGIAGGRGACDGAEQEGTGKSSRPNSAIETRPTPPSEEVLSFWRCEGNRCGIGAALFLPGRRAIGACGRLIHSADKDYVPATSLPRSGNWM